MNEIYFDNAATTRPSPRVMTKMAELAATLYGNPSSMHEMGLLAELAMKETGKTLAGILGCHYDEILYTSGGTESNNLAILGGAQTMGARFNHAITTAAEHPSVTECFKQLEQRGWRVTWLPVSETGQVDLADLAQAITAETCLVSILHVNIETGAIQDIETMGRIIRQRNDKTLFHVDAVQSFCKHPIHTGKCAIDLLSVSAHKIHGLKGTGALYRRKGVRLSPQLFGGGQQGNIRPGTENTFGIITMATAAEVAAKIMTETTNKAETIKTYLIDHLPEAVINGGPGDSPYILNLSFPGIRAEVFLHALCEKGLYISTGSACSSRAKNHSVLTAYGKPKDIVESSIRLSFSAENTLAEGEAAIALIQAVLPQLARKKA